MNTIFLVGLILTGIPILWVIYKTIVDEFWRDIVLGFVVPILMLISFALGISILFSGIK